MKPPLQDTILGTDNFGRDVFVELIHGMKTSLIIGLFAGVIATAIGVTIGLFAGYKGGTVDNILNSITNIFLVIPPFVIIDTDNCESSQSVPCCDGAGIGDYFLALDGPGSKSPVYELKG